jgi:hypothetical protein
VDVDTSWLTTVTGMSAVTAVSHGINPLETRSKHL